MRVMFISKTPQFEIHRLYAHNSLRNYTYLILQTATREVTIIDPWDAQDCLNYLKALKPAHLIISNTHQHHDHIRGNNGLIEAGAQIKLPQYLELKSLPGHTCEHVVFFLRDQSEHLFCGDTLFQAGVGNCKNGGDPSALYESVQWLKSHLHPATFLHVGHDYLNKNLDFAQQFDPNNPHLLKSLASLESHEGYELPSSQWDGELLINPFLRLSETSLRQAINKRDKSESSVSLSDKDIFIKLRSLRDHF